MDEKIEKAFGVVNYMLTLSNQRRVILEEFDQKLFYYTNGATFKITPNLIVFAKTTLDLGHASDVPFIDSNNFPVVVADVQQFIDEIVDIYFSALNDYTAKYAEIKSKRKIADIINL